MERSLTGTVMDFIMRKKVRLRSDTKLVKKTDGLREFLQKNSPKLKGPQNPSPYLPVGPTHIYLQLLEACDTVRASW